MGQKSKGTRAVWFWLRVSHEVAVELLAWVASCEGSSGAGGTAPELAPPHGCGQQPQLHRSLSVLPAWWRLPPGERSKSKVDTAVFFYDPASGVTFCHFNRILLSMPPCHCGTMWIPGPSWRLASTSGSLFGSRASLSSSVKWGGCTLAS